MPHFLSYLFNLNYLQLVNNGVDYVKSHVYTTVHDAMDEDILTSLECKRFKAFSCFP